MGILFSVPDCRRNSPDGQKDIRFTGLGNWDKHPVYSNFFYFFSCKGYDKIPIFQQGYEKADEKRRCQTVRLFFLLGCFGCISGRFSGCTNCVTGSAVLVQNRILNPA